MGLSKFALELFDEITIIKESSTHVTKMTTVSFTHISRILERSVSQSSLGEPEVPKIEELARLGSNSSFSNLVGRDNEINGFPQDIFQCEASFKTFSEFIASFK